MSENREIRRPVKKEYGLIFDGSPTASLDQCISALRKKYQGQAETSHSRDGWLQTRHTRNDESGLNPQRDSHPTREGCEQDGLPCRPSNEPDDRPERLSPQHSQRDLDEETPVDAVTRS